VIGSLSPLLRGRFVSAFCPLSPSGERASVRGLAILDCRFCSLSAPAPSSGLPAIFSPEGEKNFIERRPSLRGCLLSPLPHGGEG
jgi:hypothetical protein